MEKRRELKRELLKWIEIALGLLICVVGYRLYLIPNNIAAGGFTGIGQLVNAYTGLPIGAVSLVLNIPLFLVSIKVYGWKFAGRSLVGTVGLSLLIDLLPIGSITDDPLLAAVYGGVVTGIGFGLILRGDATTGGSDMLGKLINNKLSFFSVSVCIFIVDAFVIVASGIAFSATNAMFALISVFIMSKVIDVVLEGINTAKAYFIISAHAELIAHRILTELNRGVTGMSGQGMYSREDRQVLLCVINRTETARLKSIVAECDEKAFVIATNIHEVFGEGFER